VSFLVLFSFVTVSRVVFFLLRLPSKSPELCWVDIKLYTLNYSLHKSKGFFIKQNSTQTCSHLQLSSYQTDISLVQTSINELNSCIYGSGLADVAYCQICKLPGSCVDDMEQFGSTEVHFY